VSLPHAAPSATNGALALASRILSRMQPALFALLLAWSGALAIMLCWTYAAQPLTPQGEALIHAAIVCALPIGALAMILYGFRGGQFNGALFAAAPSWLKRWTVLMLLASGIHLGASVHHGSPYQPKAEGGHYWLQKKIDREHWVKVTDLSKETYDIEQKMVFRTLGSLMASCLGMAAMFVHYRRPVIRQDE
jgi:hypothetical protein